jgi:excisionase family DNA binding protein
MSVDQLADFLGVSKNTVFGLTRARTKRSGAPVLAHIRVGKSLRFRRSSVDAWLAAKEQAARG